jgi:sugar/nucleoside kinase (ribokinase family)
MPVSYDLVAVGDVMLDVHVFASPLGGVVHDAIRVRAGGSAVNAARSARRLGAHAAVVGGVGDDAAGAAIRDALRRDGIDALLEMLPAATGTVAYVGTGVVADRGANASFRPGALPSARVTLVSGYLEEDAVREALTQAQGLRALDLQRPRVHAFEAEVVLGPELDLDALGGRHDVVCSTLGARGATGVRGDERVEVAVSRVLAESPRGAGDAFAAGFLLALADGHELGACLERGCEAALHA